MTQNREDALAQERACFALDKERWVESSFATAGELIAAGAAASILAAMELHLGDHMVQFWALTALCM